MLRNETIYSDLLCFSWMCLWSSKIRTFIIFLIFRLHKTSVHEDKTISCEVCGKVLKNERYLKDHMIGHSAGKRFSCELCGKSFRWPNGLLKHKKYHSDEMPFSCNICNKSFREKATLQNHKIIHNKDLYFKCELCLRTFSFQSALNRHCVRVHKLEKESLGNKK